MKSQDDIEWARVIIAHQICMESKKAKKGKEPTTRYVCLMGFSSALQWAAGEPGAALEDFLKTYDRPGVKGALPCKFKAEGGYCRLADGHHGEHII